MVWPIIGGRCYVGSMPKSTKGWKVWVLSTSDVPRAGGRRVGSGRAWAGQNCPNCRREISKSANWSNSQKPDASRHCVPRRARNTLRRNATMRPQSGSGALHRDRSGLTNLHMFARFNHGLHRSPFRKSPHLSGFANLMRVTSARGGIAHIHGIGRRWRTSWGLQRTRKTGFRFGHNVARRRNQDTGLWLLSWCDSSYWTRQPSRWTHPLPGLSRRSPSRRRSTRAPSFAFTSVVCGLWSWWAICPRCRILR